MKEKLSLFWTILLERFKVTSLLVIAILIYGSIAYYTIPREITPSIDIPIANVITLWPGASPEDVEKLITNKIEGEIKDLENVKEYTSRSVSGMSIVTIEFDINSDKNRNIQNLREKIETTKKELPQTILDDPEINEVSLSDEPILGLTLSGDFSWTQLKRFAEVIESDLKSIQQVKDIRIDGLPEEQVHILVDPLQMKAHGVSIGEIIQTIRAHHIDMPLGQIDSSGGKIEVSVRSEMKNVSEFLALPIKKSTSGAIIRLEDFAEARREFDEFAVETTFVNQNGNKPAVFINVIKSAAKGNIITMVEEAIDRIETLKSDKKIPQSLNTDITFNRADDINESLSTLVNSGKQTLILIALVMFLALGWRESILASTAIPLAMMIGIIVLNILGRTFNGISLFALVLSIGLLVDNAIIIVEGISEAIHERKRTPIQAAKETLTLFRWPIISGTLTTIFAFLPMLFYISGISGQYISVVPVTVITILIGALFIALFLLPSLSIYFYNVWKPKPKKNTQLKKIQNWYESTMRSILNSRMNIINVCVLTTLFFLFSIGLVVSRQVPIEVFPESDSVVFGIQVEYPEGTPLDQTKDIIPAIENVLHPYMESTENRSAWIKSFIFTAGQPSSSIRGGINGMSLSQSNILGVTVNLTDKASRETPSYEIVSIIEKEFQPIIPSHAELKLQQEQGGPPTGAPIEILILGPDMDRLELLSQEIKKNLARIPETKNITDSQNNKTIQMNWTLKRDVMTNLGLTPSQIIEPLRASINGVTVVQLTEGEDEVDVDIRIDWDGTKAWQTVESLERIDQIPLLTQRGESITFRQIAEPDLSAKSSQINHKNGERIVTIQADTEIGVVVSQIMPQVETILSDISLLPGERIEFGGDSEEGNRIMGEMAQSMLMAILLIFLVLVFQFNSYIQPLIILAIVPLSLTSIFIGFWILGLAVSFPTMIGIVALSGIIVNDAIVLIDRINQYRLDNNSYIESYIQAGKERMQPIFLTSITTVVGLLPLSLSDKVWAGLGFAIIFGMMLSTILTLLLIPCFLIIARNAESKIKGFFKQKS